MSALDDIMRNNNAFLFTEIRKKSAMLDELIKDKLFNFLKFEETNDVSWLIKAQNKYKEQKENKDPNTTDSSQTTNNSNPILQIKIKQEKLSISSTKPKSSKQSILSGSSVASEESSDNKDYMPAPLKLPPRKKKIKSEPVESPPPRQTRSTRTKPKIQVNKNSLDIQNSTITVSLNEDKNSKKKSIDNEQSQNLPIRTTRTKTRLNKKKEEEAELEKSKISKSNQKEASSYCNESETNTTAYEDAVDTNNTDTVNATMVIEEPKILNTNVNYFYKTPPRTKSKKQQIQEIFSPYEKNLKKKVEAFEKFGSNKQHSSASKIPQLGSTMKSLTPLKKIQPLSSSTTKIKNKFFPDKKNSFQYNESLSASASASASALSMKSLSTLKASQAEYREREKLRQEKEKEAQLKKEAILQAQAEDKRRKREEKQLKAQQQRDLLLLKEKQKLLELQKQREERHKQAREKEEKLQKSKAEAEKKKLNDKIKAKLTKDREAAEKMTVPIYLTTKAPLLPSLDCYDSDDERYAEHHKKAPNWCSGNKQLNAQLIAGDKIKNTLFCSVNENPDLVQIFQHVDSRKLKRTSSAQWRKPPRYTLFSETLDIIFSDDSD